MIENSKDPRHVLIEQMIVDCEPPFHRDLIEPAKILSILNARDGALAGMRMHIGIFRKYLLACGARNLAQVKGRLEGREVKRGLYLLRNFDAYAHLSQREILDKYFEGLSSDESPF